MAKKKESFKLKLIFQPASPYVRIIYNKRKIILFSTFIFFLLIVSFLTLQIFSRFSPSPSGKFPTQVSSKPTPTKSPSSSYPPLPSTLPSPKVYQEKSSEELITAVEEKLKIMKEQKVPTSVVENYLSLGKEFLEKSENQKAKENLTKAAQLADEYLYYLQNKPTEN